MSAELFTVPFQCVVVTGLAVPGATLTFYQTGTTTKLPIYTTSALTTTRTNPVVANSSGRIPNTYLDTAQTYRLVIKDKAGATLEDIDPYIPGVTTLGITLTSATGQSVNSVGALAALSPVVNNQVAWLTQAGREGMFVFDSSNLSAMVLLDAGQWDYVAPASAPSGSSGAWVRRLSDLTIGLFATRSALAARDQLLGRPAILTEAGRGGTFEWDGSDLSALVSADPEQGIYVAPSSDTTGASGAWVRQFSILAISTWWGVSTANTAAANVTAFQAALDTLEALKIVAYGYGNGSIGLHTPAGTYQFDASLTINHGLAVTGDYNGQGEDGTNFVWTALCHGFTTSLNALGYTIRGFMLRGAYAGTEGNYHGINMVAKGQHIDLFGDHWPGNFIEAHGNIPTSNINGSLFQNIFAQNCQWTIHTSGGDANGCVGININAILNRRGNILEASFLGNYWAGGFVETCGNHAGFLSRCESGGHIYVVAFGQETWCSTNAPTGAATSNTGWLYLADAAASAAQPAWTTGQTWYWSAANAVAPDQSSNWSNFYGFYHEGNCNPVILNGRSIYIPGFPGVPIWRSDGTYDGGSFFVSGDSLIMNNGLLARGPIGYATGAGGTVTQTTNKGSAVTVNTPCGQIVMSSAALGAGAKTSFLVNCSLSATDGVDIWVAGGFAAAQCYRAWIDGVSAGLFRITVENISAGSLSEALVIGFAIKKVVTS